MYTTKQTLPVVITTRENDNIVITTIFIKFIPCKEKYVYPNSKL